jgi:hypothetical protein
VETFRLDAKTADAFAVTAAGTYFNVLRSRPEQILCRKP